MESLLKGIIPIKIDRTTISKPTAIPVPVTKKIKK